MRQRFLAVDTFVRGLLRWRRSGGQKRAQADPGQHGRSECSNHGAPPCSETCSELRSAAGAGAPVSSRNPARVIATGSTGRPCRRHPPSATRSSPVTSRPARPSASRNRSARCGQRAGMDDPDGPAALWAAGVVDPRPAKAKLAVDSTSKHKKRKRRAAGDAQHEAQWHHRPGAGIDHGPGVPAR